MADPRHFRTVRFEKTTSFYERFLDLCQWVMDGADPCSFLKLVSVLEQARRGSRSAGPTIAAFNAHLAEELGKLPFPVYEKRKFLNHRPDVDFTAIFAPTSVPRSARVYFLTAALLFSDIEDFKQALLEEGLPIKQPRHRQEFSFEDWTGAYIASCGRFAEAGLKLGATKEMGIEMCGRLGLMLNRPGFRGGSEF